jgi:hypothetical protein
VGTIVTKERLYFGKEGYKYIPMPYTLAAGFTTQDCDFVTTWQAVQDYERVRTWKVTGEDGAVQKTEVVQRTLEVTISGRKYGGDLRNVGPFALDLGLACVDLGVDPQTLSRVSLNTDFAGSLDHPETFQGLPGTPIFDERGEVVSMYVDLSGSRRYISAANILAFLKEVRNVARSRPLLLKR